MAILRTPVAILASGEGRSSFYAKARDGLMVKPFKLGKRASAVLATEIAALNQARAAGKSDDEIRALVTRLEAARQEAVV